MTQFQRITRQVPLEPWEVGAELLDILSRGLYSDAKDALREYAQNGVDAGAENITITIDGNRATIRDDGEGMDDQTLHAARRFGMSAKTPKNMVGYRGIGIYSAFGICEELTITTRMSGMDGLIGWVFHFGAMRRILEEDKNSDVRQGIGLANLLLQHTEMFSERYGGDKTNHFTVVELNGIGEEYRSQLNDASEVNNYLLNTIPVAYPVESYGESVNELLRSHVGLNPVHMILIVGDEPEIEVRPSLANDLYDPEFEWILASDSTKLAFIWYALTKTGRQIPTQNNIIVNGILMKMKGFTLGDRLTLKALWPAVGGRTLYHHYVGEMHVLDDAEVYPNAARNDLEPSPSKQLLMNQAAEYFEPMSRVARAMQAETRARRLVQGLDENLESMKVRLDDPNSSVFDVYREVSITLEDLEKSHSELIKTKTKPRLKPNIQLSEIQNQEFDEATASLNRSIRTLSDISRRAKRRAQESQSRAPAKPRQIPPQTLRLREALNALETMATSVQDDRVSEALDQFKTAVRQNAIPNAIMILDTLKAQRIELTDSTESARKELRSLIGWSPLAPVSLDEALSQSGVALETEREETLIQLIDEALIASLGGRGDTYEMAIRAMAESISDEYGD